MLLDCPHCLRKINTEKYKEHIQNCDPQRIPISYSLDKDNIPKKEIIKTGVSCRNTGCEGEIISKTDEINPYPVFFQVKGPAGERQSHFETIYYCNICGVCYHFLPESD